VSNSMEHQYTFSVVSVICLRSADTHNVVHYSLCNAVERGTAGIS
jgi:hypothetical protein